MFKLSLADRPGRVRVDLLGHRHRERLRVRELHAQHAALTFNADHEPEARTTPSRCGDCHGGSLRWSVRTSPTQSVFIYYGDEPEHFTDCTTQQPERHEHDRTQSDLRYDTSQYPGGTFYDSYAHALTLIGNTPIIRPRS